MASYTFQLGDGRTMPGVGLGTYQMSESDAEAAVTTALKLGYRHVDTAEGYSNEVAIGRALKAASVQHVFVTTKLWPGNPQWGMPAKTYQQTVEACEQSLANLGIDAIGLYLVHAPTAGSSEARVAQWKAIVDCQARGLCRSIGVSNFGVAHLKEIEAAGLPLPAANQLELHPMTQKSELLGYMRARKILPIAYSSLAPLSNWREGYERPSGTKTEEEKQERPTIEAIATRLGVSQARVLLRFALQRGWPCLPKTTKEERLRGNLDLDSFTLSDNDMKALDALEANANLAWDAPTGQHFDLTALS